MTSPEAQIQAGIANISFPLNQEQKKTTPLKLTFVLFFCPLTLTSAAAALKLIFATDSLLRRRGSRLRPERELVKEQSEAAPGVMGV